MTDKNRLIEVLVCIEDTTGCYRVGEVTYGVHVNELEYHLRTYGKRELKKVLKYMLEYVDNEHKKIKKEKKKLKN